MFKPLRSKQQRDHDDYCYYWIRHLISNEIILNNEFKDWIKGFRERYEKITLARMSFAWSVRKQSLAGIYIKGD